MTVKSLNHIGVVVRSIDDRKPFYEDILGLQFEGLEEVPLQKVRVAFFRAGDVRIELLEPTHPDSAVAKFLEKRGEGLHHLSFAVDDIQTRIDELKQRGLEVIDAQPRLGAHQMQTAFVHPKSCFGVLVELCEPARVRGSDETT